MCLSHSLGSFTYFQDSKLWQREFICAFFLAFSLAALTGLQRGNSPVATVLLGNKRSDLVHSAEFKGSLSPLSGTQLQELVSIRHPQVEMAACKQEKKPQLKKKKLFLFVLFYIDWLFVLITILKYVKYNKYHNIPYRSDPLQIQLSLV